LHIWTGERKILQLSWGFIKGKDDLEYLIHGLETVFRPAITGVASLTTAPLT
jgi:hypothetical protein